MCGGGDGREHPDQEEVIRDHGLHLRETNALETDTGYDLLVGEGEE